MAGAPSGRTLWECKWSWRIAEIRPDCRFDETCPGSVPEALTAFLDAKDFENTPCALPSPSVARPIPRRPSPGPLPRPSSEESQRGSRLRSEPFSTRRF